jgi:hypothetical protein
MLSSLPKFLCKFGIYTFLCAKPHSALHGLKSDMHLIIDRDCVPRIDISCQLYAEEFQFDPKDVGHHSHRRVLTCGESSTKNVIRSKSSLSLKTRKPLTN